MRPPLPLLLSPLLLLHLPSTVLAHFPDASHNASELTEFSQALQDALQDHNTNHYNSTNGEPLNQTLHIAGLYDLGTFPDWPGHLMNFTVQLINNKTDGWHDELLNDGSTLVSYTMNNSGCNPDVAVRSYLERMRDGPRPHGIFGCRCSGASMAVARLCAVENIPILSPASTSVKLSDKVEYPTFSRLVGPDNDHGQVGALISLLRSFGWDRISVLNTDTQFTKDIALELSDAWKGKHLPPDPFFGDIAYTDTIKLNKTTDLIDMSSAIRVLNAVPTDKPAQNSRVIVLFAHNQHAFPILKLAGEMGFQPDTIWVGTSEWVGRQPNNGDVSWMPPIPGYLGLAPYRNKTAPKYLDFLGRLQQYERENFIQPMTEDLPDYVADRVVDGTLALAQALDSLPPDLRTDGVLVSQALRNLEFEGLSGPIGFQSTGDFRDPRYMVMTMSSRGEGWIPIGFATPSIANVALNQVCYAEVGCVSSIPNDEYPPEKDLLPFWIWIVIGLLVFITILLYHQRMKSKNVTAKLTRIEQELAALDSNDDAVKMKKGRLYKEIAQLLDQPTPEHWTNNLRGNVVGVTPLDEEYWQVLETLRETMNEGEECHLSQLTRIQNEGIWSYYVFRKNQLANKYGVDLNDDRKLKEASVWHGTSSLNPDVIYRDQQDGFMMQLSQQGHWGRGIYFSERSGYSDPYSFKPLTEHHDSDQQDRELFLVKLLVGEAIMLDRTEGEWMAEACAALCTPPDNPNFNGYKFDTVAGIIEDEAKTKIYVVYENGRAYPEYLVRYYKGKRDPTRSPFETWEDVVAERENQESPNPRESTNSEVYLQLKESSSKCLGYSPSLQSLAIESERDLFGEEGDDFSEGSEVSAKGIWQYQDDKGKWINYLNGHQIQLETAYQQDKSGVTTIETFPWTYAVDFSVNLQTNLDHPERRTRAIRRIHIDHLDVSHRNLRSSGSFRFSARVSASKRRLLHPEAIAEGLIEDSREMDAASSISGPDSDADINLETHEEEKEEESADTPDGSTDFDVESNLATAANAIDNIESNVSTAADTGTDFEGNAATAECYIVKKRDDSNSAMDGPRMGLHDSADAGAGLGVTASSMRSLGSNDGSVLSHSSLYPSARDIASVNVLPNRPRADYGLYPSLQDNASLRSVSTEPSYRSRSMDMNGPGSTSSLPVQRSARPFSRSTTSQSVTSLRSVTEMPFLESKFQPAAVEEPQTESSKDESPSP